MSDAPLPSNQRVDLQELRHIAREVGQNMSHSMEDDIEQAADEIERLRVARAKDREVVEEALQFIAEDWPRLADRLREQLSAEAAPRDETKP